MRKMSATVKRTLYQSVQVQENHWKALILQRFLISKAVTVASVKSLQKGHYGKFGFIPERTNTRKR